MAQSDWSRRELLKSVGTGVVALGTGATIYTQMRRYLVGINSGDGVTAATSISETDPMRIDLTAHTPWRVLGGTYSQARVQSLLSRNDVVFAQPDRQLETLATTANERTQTVPWGIDRIGATVVQEAGGTGAGVDVGVIDSGLTDTHPDLTDNIASPAEDANHNAWVTCRSGACEHQWSDDGGHGTHVAGTIAATNGTAGVVGAAPAATLHALKVCGATGLCRTSAVIKAIRYAADQNWDVINLSLGASQPSPALQAAGEYARAAGVVPVAAAGNQGRPDSVGYPAAYEEFLAVAATTIEDNSAAFSSTGPEVDIAAPGADVCAPVPDGYGVRSGTSMATPHVAGAAAQLRAAGYSATETRQRLIDTAEDIGLAVTEQGAGIVDVAAALGYDHDGDIGDGTMCPTTSVEHAG